MAELLAEFKYLIPLELISCVRRFHLCNMHSSCIFHVYTVYGFSFDASFVLVPDRRVVFTWFLSRPESCACVPVPDLVVLCTRFLCRQSCAKCAGVRNRGKRFPFKSVSRAQQNRSIGRNRSIGPKRENPGYDGVAHVLE